MREGARQEITNEMYYTADWALTEDLQQFMKRMRTILVKYRDSQGNLNHMMTTDAARVIVEERSSMCWVYADNQLIQADRVNEDIDWESVSQICILPALRSYPNFTSLEGEEE